MDAIELSLFASRIEAVCDEMGAVLRRSAFSPNIRDRLDFSCAVFDAAGEQTIATPAGKFDALRLVKRKEGPDDHGTEIWLAPDHGYLPIRILITDKDGTRIDQVVTRIGAP